MAQDRKRGSRFFEHEAGDFPGKGPFPRIVHILGADDYGSVSRCLGRSLDRGKRNGKEKVDLTPFDQGKNRFDEIDRFSGRFMHLPVADHSRIFSPFSRHLPTQKLL
jgi:hypothetical protein